MDRAAPIVTAPPADVTAVDPPRPARRLTLAVALAVVVVDQLTKHWALGALADGRTIDLVGSLRFNLAFNTGASFSLGENLGPVVAVAAVIVSVVLLRLAGRVPGRPAAIAVGLIVGGAVGNVIDRAFRAGDGVLGGAVVDFIDLQWWPIFNVADMGIVVGSVLLVVVGFGLGDRGADPGADPGAAP